MATPDPMSSVYGVDTLVQEWIQYLSISELADTTVLNHRSRIRTFAKWANETRGIPAHDLREINNHHLRKYMRFRKLNGISDGTRLLDWITLKKFFEWLMKEEPEAFPENPMKEVERPPQTKRIIQFASADEFDKILETCDNTPLGRRDTAILLLLRDTGVRASELLKIKQRDIFWHQNTIHIHATKTRDERLVAYGDATALALSRYKRVRPTFPYADSDYFFIGYKGPLQYAGLRYMLKKRSEQAGVYVKAHGLRHLWVHEEKEAGASDDFLQVLGGWNSKAMLEVYAEARIEERALNEYKEKRLSPVDRRYSRNPRVRRR